MDIPNAFLGKPNPPTQNELDAALAETASVWNQLVTWLAQQGVADQEWKSSGMKYGWSLRLKVKKRNIVYLGPCAGCFRAAFVFGEKAVAAARQSNLSKKTLKLLDEAPQYAEGTAVRLLIKTARDLAEVRKLAAIKLTN
jgi:hypothetical protein